MIASSLSSAASAQETVSFQRDVLPLLRARCQGCHQPARPKGDIVLVTHGDLLERPLDETALLVPGKPEESVLIDVITPFGDTPPEMPEDADPLTDDQVELLRSWIREGALDDTPKSFRSRPTGPPTYARPPVITSLQYSPSGEQIAVAGRGEVLLHRRDGSAIVRRLIGLSERIESVAYSPDGTQLAVAGGSPARMGELQVWDVATGELTLSIPTTNDTLRGVSWSPDGSKLAFGCKDSTLRAVNVKNGTEILYQSAHADWVLGTAFSTDATHVVSIGRDRSMKLIKLETQQFIDNITSITPGALKGGLLSVVRHPKKDELLVGGSDGTPKIFRMYREEKRVIGDDYNLLHTFNALPGRVFAVDWSPTADWIVAGSSATSMGNVRSFNVEDGAERWSHDFDAGIYTLDVHPAGDHIAVAGFRGDIVVLDASTGEFSYSFASVPLADPPLETTDEPVIIEASQAQTEAR